MAGESIRGEVLGNGHVLSVPLVCFWVEEGGLACDFCGLLNPILMKAKLCTRKKSCKCLCLEEQWRRVARRCLVFGVVQANSS